MSAFLYNISILPAFIVPKKLVQQQGEKFFNKPVGTGPFVVKEWLLGLAHHLRTNPYYWETGKPYLDEVRYDFTTDDNARMLALQSGQAQAVDGVPFSEISQPEDGLVRLSAVLDRAVLRGTLAQPQEALVRRPERAPGAAVRDRQGGHQQDRLRRHGDDPEQRPAGAALRRDAAAAAAVPLRSGEGQAVDGRVGFPNGFSTTLQYPAGFAYYNRLALILQAAWQQIGVNVKLIQQDQGTESQRFYQMDYDMTFPYAQFTSDVVVPDEYISFIFDPTSGTNGFFTDWHDDAIWKMVQEFESRR